MNEEDKKISWLKRELAKAEENLTEVTNYRNQLKLDLYSAKTGIAAGTYVTRTFVNGVVRHDFLVEEIFCDSAGNITLVLRYTFPATGKRFLTSSVGAYTACERVGVKRDG